MVNGFEENISDNIADIMLMRRKITCLLLLGKNI